MMLRGEKKEKKNHLVGVGMEKSPLLATDRVARLLLSALVMSHGTPTRPKQVIALVSE